MVAPLISRSVALAATRGLFPAARALTRRQQKMAANAAFASGVITELAIQYLGIPTFSFNTSVETLCGGGGGEGWANGGCGQLGSPITQTDGQMQATIANRNPILALNQVIAAWRYEVPHPVFGAGYALGRVVQVVQNKATARPLYGSRPLPLGVAQAMPVPRDIVDARPYTAVPPFYGITPGLSSRPGPAPWAPARPAPRPPAKPWEKPGEIVNPGTIPRPAYRPGFIPRAVPARMEKQTKVAFAPAGVAPRLFEWLERFSEFADVVNALYEALPADVRRRYDPAIQRQGDLLGGIGGGGRQAEATNIKLQALWNNLGQLDGQQAAANLLVNMVEDMAVGATEGARGDLFNRIRGS